MEKPLGAPWVGVKFGWSRATGNHQGGTNRVSQVDGVSNLVPACLLCGGRAQTKNKGVF